MTDDQHKLLLLEKSNEHLEVQLKRLISHVESEQRVTGNISKRVDQVEKLTDKHEKMLINTGQGLMFRIDRIEQRSENSKSSLNTWLSVFALIISLISVIVMILQTQKGL